MVAWWWTSVLVGCSSAPEPAATTDGAEGEETSLPTSTSGERPLAGGLQIFKISMFQGVETVLYEDGKEPDDLQVPVIVGRDGLLRVFVDPDEDFDTRKVTGVLTITANDEEDVVLEANRRVEDRSKINDPDSTINFDIPGDLIKRSTEMELQIVEEDPSGPGGGEEADVTWSSKEEGELDVELTDELKVVIVPIRYNADGSGRMPDTSEAQVARIADLVKGTYPASEVIVEVDEPFDWDTPIRPFDTDDWTQILNAVGFYRADADEPANTYYYGAFAPEPTVSEFCQQGCILGLSYLGFSATDPFFRASVGIGYSGTITSETLVHEMGHAHGREHAPCGLYGQPSDRNYPYDDAELGVWGYDIVSGEWHDPDEAKDMMSYCGPLWVSDYTVYNLVERMQAVADQSRAAPIRRSSVMVSADGVSTLGPQLTSPSTAGAPRVPVSWFDEQGAPAGEGTAAFYPLSHGEGGGIAVLDTELPPGWSAIVR